MIGDRVPIHRTGASGERKPTRPAHHADKPAIHQPRHIDGRPIAGVLDFEGPNTVIYGGSLMTNVRHAKPTAITMYANCLYLVGIPWPPT